MDFANYLVLLARAAGARQVQSQRSAPWSDVLAFFLHNFRTTVTTAIALPGQAGPPGSVTWFFHQWAIDGTVFDGCVRPGGTVTLADVEGPDVNSDYYVSVVASLAPEPPWWIIDVWPLRPYLPWYPPAPFLPTITE